MFFGEFDHGRLPRVFFARRATINNLYFFLKTAIVNDRRNPYGVCLRPFLPFFHWVLSHIFLKFCSETGMKFTRLSIRTQKSCFLVFFFDKKKREGKEGKKT